MRPRRAHALKDITTTRVPDSMIWVDTETLNPEGVTGLGYHTLYLGLACYRLYKRERLIREEWTFFRKANEFWEWVTGVCDDYGETVIYAHNWNFDGGILSPEINLPELGFELLKHINDGTPPVIITYRKVRQSLRLLDTLNYFTSSLAAMGSSVGLEKLPLPESAEDDDVWIEYCRRDVEILRDAVLLLRSFILENDLGSMANSLAGLSFAAYRKRFMGIVPMIHDRVRYLEIERAAYHGGRSEAFWRGHIPEPVWKLDVNSLYPAMMLGPISYKPDTFLREIPVSMLQEIIDSGQGVAAVVDVNTDIPAYPYYDGERLLFPIGRWTDSYCTPEISMMLAHGHITRVRLCATYHRDILFADFVRQCFAWRMEYRAAGNKAFDYMAKILMNSLYGKFGQRGRVWTDKEPDMPDWFGDTVGWNMLDDGRLVKMRLRHGRTQYLSKDAESEQSVPIIAAEITALARQHLWRLIEAAGEVYYVDTDSLVVGRSGLDNLQAHIGDKLGELKIEESEQTDAEIWTAKDYSLSPDKVILKGVRKPERGKREYTQVRFRSWDYMQSQGKHGEILIDEITKTISGKNVKRNIKESEGWTFPLVFDIIDM